MDIYDYLQYIGYTMEEISKLFDEKLLISTQSGIVINDYDLLLKIVDSYNGEYKLFSYSNNKINSLMEELFRLIKLEQNKLAYELALRIKTIIQIPELDLIINNIDKDKDPLHYILHDGIYPSKVTNDGLKKYERDMLLDFLTGDDRSGNDRMIKLAKLYVYQAPNPFVTYKAYLTSILDLEKNHTHINVRKDASALGNPIGVLCALLKCHDYHRAHSLIKSVYIDNIKEEFSVIWEIFRLLDNKITELLERNTLNVYKQMELNSNGLNSIKEIIKGYDLSRIDGNLINEMSKHNDYTLEENKDYYKEYITHKEEGNFEEARLDIIKHKRKLDSMGIFVDYDYLIKEADVLIYNDINTTYEEKEKYNECIKKADCLMSNKKYNEAISLYIESLNYQAKEFPLTLSKIAECYMELDEYELAINYYMKESKDYLYPIDYLHYIECLYHTHRYEEIFPLADGYEYYYPDESAFVHYILSICYLDRNDYKRALDEIETCEIICMEYYDLALNFNYEKNIIKDLERGKDLEVYTLNDYYNHCFSDYLLKRINSLNIDDYPEDGSLLMHIIDEDNNERIEDRLNFLLKLSKTLIEMNRKKDAIDLLKYIEELIKVTDLSPTDNEHFTVVLKNYRKL